VAETNEFGDAPPILVEAGEAETFEESAEREGEKARLDFFFLRPAGPRRRGERVPLRSRGELRLWANGSLGEEETWAEVKLVWSCVVNPAVGARRAERRETAEARKMSSPSS